MIHFYGDSITAGVPGISFCKYLKCHIDYKNHGIGGDTVTGLINRIQGIKFDTKDYYVLEIGTNDILLPYLKNKSRIWENTIKRIEKTGRIITKDKDEFTKKYAELLGIFKNLKTIIISIPCIGEDIESDVNKKVDLYNNEIIKLCVSIGGYYIDFNEWQKKEIKIHSLENQGFLNNNALGMIVDIILTKNLRLANYLSTKRNLCTTIDGVHLNSNGALSLANMVEKTITRYA